MAKTTENFAPVVTFLCEGKILISEYTKTNADGTPGETVLSAKLLSTHAIEYIREVLGVQHFPVFIHSAWLNGVYEYRGMVAKAPQVNNVWKCGLLLLEKPSKNPLILCTPMWIENVDNTIKNEEHRQIQEALSES